jgi:hypothetical protein
MLLNGLYDLHCMNLDTFGLQRPGYCISAYEVSSLGFGLVTIYTIL